MTGITKAPKTIQDPEIATAAAQFLSPVVNNLTALSIDGKQAHWHVRGLNFQAVHELLDDIVDYAREATDMVAERVVALGLPIDARYKTVAKEASIPTVSAGFHQAAHLIGQIVDQIDATLETLRVAIDGLAEIDAVSQDVAIEVARELEKNRWFLTAHISE